MSHSTFSGYDINSLTNLSELILRISRDKSFIPDLTWTTQIINFLETNHRAEKNGILVWDGLTNSDERCSKIQITDDQGKKLIVEYGSGIQKVYRPGEVYDFGTCVHRIEYGIAKEFPEFFKTRFSQLQDVVKKESVEVEFYFNTAPRDIYLVMNRPLITSKHDELAVKKYLDLAKIEAGKIVQEFQKSHFMGEPANKWELYVYTKSDEASKEYYDGLKLESGIFSVLSPTSDYSGKVTRLGNVIHFTLYQYVEDQSTDFPGILTKLRETYFKNETTKIFDKNDTIKPIE